MSLLSLPNEIVLNFILSRDIITVSDLFQLMLSCRQLHNLIFDSNQLWMCKFLTRWPDKHNHFQGNEKILWKDWVFTLRIIEEVKKDVTSLSSQCYPLGKCVTPVLAVEKWFQSECYPNFLFNENELYDLIFNEGMESDFTQSYYASVALKKLKNCLQVRNLNMFVTKCESQKTLLEGAKLISSWFQYSADELTNRTKFVDNVEPDLQEMVERVKQLAEERNSTALQDILKCINTVLFGEMSFRVYTEDDFHDWNHSAASIHKVLGKGIGYPAVLCVIYLEVAFRMGITCEPICLDCAHCSEKLILRCRVDGVVDVYFIGICGSSFFDLPSIHPDLIDQPASSFEVIFGQMLEDVVVRNLTCPYLSQSEKCMADLRSSLRLVCVFWPVQVNVLKYAELCLEANDQVDDAYQLLMSTEIDSNHQVMIDCIQRLSSQQAVTDAAKVARLRLPSIVYAVGLVMTIHVFGVLHDVDCIIVSWDECFREEVSCRKWGLPFEAITDGYRRNQPFYHVICYLSPEEKFYVPQETLRLCSTYGFRFHHNVERLFADSDICIFFERFEGRRFVSNAEHKAHFPEDDAVASAMVEQLSSWFSIAQRNKMWMYIVLNAANVTAREDKFSVQNVFEFQR